MSARRDNDRHERGDTVNDVGTQRDRSDRMGAASNEAARAGNPGLTNPTSKES